MPGITGIISRAPTAHCRVRLNAMLATMMHENFYKSSAYAAPDLGIYAGVIGFEDSDGDGIFFNESKEVALIFSGECILDARTPGGQRLIELYESAGEKFLEQLNGLFCGVLIDRRLKRILLFNDRYGLQRIYFHELGDELYFASEAKVLLRILPATRQFSSEGVADFLAFGCVLDWKTLFHGIQIMPGGSSWIFENGDCRKQNYFSPANWESQPLLSDAEFERQFHRIFKKILPRYFHSSEKIGVALTGGLDTRMIMACRPQQNGHTTCYTFSGNDGQTLDDKIAARVAAASGLEHRLLRLGPDFFRAFQAHADKTVFVTDGTAGVCQAHEIYLNRFARQLAPTRLTGNYGSEILRGISTFKPVPLSAQLFAPDMRGEIFTRAEKLAAYKRQSPVTFAAFREIPWNLFGNLAAGRSQLHFRSPYLDNELVALACRAPETMRKSSLPLLRLVRKSHPALSEIPTDRGFGGENSGWQFWSRRLFAEATFKVDYYHNEGLPDFLAPFEPVLKNVGGWLGFIGRHKFLHYRSWFRNELAPYVTEMLAQSFKNNFLNGDFVKRAAAEHVGGRRNYSLEINAILTLESVERQMFRELPRD